MSHLYFLIGPPGSGKRTVGKALAELTGAALLDNHAWNDPVFRAFGADGLKPLPPLVWELAREIRQVTFRAIRFAPPEVSHILTSYLTASESDEKVRALAAQRGANYVPVVLECDPLELARRMPLPERQERAKLRDPHRLQELLAEQGQLTAPRNAIRLNTTRLSPADAALLIATHAGALF